MDSSLIDQIRRSNDIVDVIGSYLRVKRQGSAFLALCPFHNDSHPSLNISPQKQIYKCFACGKAGNVITFVQDYEKLSFIEAVKKLAQRVGIIIPEREQTKVVSTKRELLLQVYRSAKDFYANNLFQYGSHVLEYLQNRHISPETAKALELGYALNSASGLKSHLLKEAYGVDILKECGLLSNVQGNLIDQFQERLMFPIHNNTGEVIAFSGRVLEGSTDNRKYLNSPGTELYTKGNELYGLHKTKYNVAKEECAIICEGNIDFLRLYESGVTNAVATLGTAMTDNQIYLLGRYTPHMVMLYDGDLAGRKAALRAALLILSKGFAPRIALLPEKEDPDSYLLKHSKEDLLKLVTAARTVIAFMADDTSLEIGTQDKIEQLTDAIRQVRDPIQKEFLLKDIAEAFFISEGSLRQKLRQGSRMHTPLSTPTDEAEACPEERLLLILTLKDEENYNLLAHELSADYFLNDNYKQIYRYLTAQDRAADLSEPARLLDQVENTALREQLADLLFEELPEISFGQALHEVIVRKLQHEIEVLDRRIVTEPNNRELFKQREALSKQVNELIPHVTTDLIE